MCKKRNVVNIVSIANLYELCPICLTLYLVSCNALKFEKIDDLKYFVGKINKQEYNNLYNNYKVCFLHQYYKKEIKNVVIIDRVNGDFKLAKNKLN